MKETHMQTFFSKWSVKNPPEENEAYELKITSGNAIRFDAVKPHQIKFLLEVEEGEFYHRIIDQPIFYGSGTRFTIQKPFDCLFMIGGKGYVVVWFYVPRTRKVFYKIPVKKFLQMEKEAERKSFTEEMVKNYSEPIYIT